MEGNFNLSKIEELIRPLIEKTGYSLYDLEFQGRVLRVSIEKPGGVTLTDCVETSRLLNPVLDVEDIIPGGAYELEVSSPGLDRNLRRPEHFNSVLGTRIHVTTTEPMSQWNQGEYFTKRRNIRGTLTKFDGVQLNLLADGHEVTIPLAAVTRAYVDWELKTTPKKGKKD